MNLEVIMAHKTFISYKYSEAQELRDRIIKAFGDDEVVEMVKAAQSMGIDLLLSEEE